MLLLIMDLIMNLLRWRLDNFLAELGIDITNSKHILWPIIRDKLFTHRYVSIYTQKNRNIDYFLLIKNIIWKGIVVYEATLGYYSYKLYTYMLHKNVKQINTKTNETYPYISYDLPYISYDLILNPHIIPASDNIENIDIMINLIITKFILSDIIITRCSVPDISIEIKKNIYYLMLVN